MNDLKSMLENAKTIAVVGLSDNPERPSNQVARYLQAAGYKIIPVNPTIKKALGETAFASLRDINEPVDIVDIFRRSEDVPPIVEDAIAMGAKAVWMQIGVVNAEAAARATEAGLDVVMDRCIKVDHSMLGL